MDLLIPDSGLLFWMTLVFLIVLVGILLNGNGKFEGLPLNRALYDDHGQV